MLAAPPGAGSTRLEFLSRTTLGQASSRGWGDGNSGNSGATMAKASMPELAEAVVVPADDGQPIRLWRAGRGRPLILLHEWAADHTAWD